MPLLDIADIVVIVDDVVVIVAGVVIAVDGNADGIFVCFSFNCLDCRCFGELSRNGVAITLTEFFIIIYFFFCLFISLFLF
jgi:Na+-driven multidrug efflux pump